MIIVSVLIYRNGCQRIEQETINHLVSVNIFKSSQFDRWVEDSRQSSQELAQHPLLRQYAAVLSSHDTPEIVYYRTKKKLIQDHFLTRLKFGRFQELSLLCPEHGTILASTSGKQEGRVYNGQAYFIKGKAQTHVQGIYYSKAIEQPVMTIGTPVKDVQGNLLAVLAGHLNLQELTRIMEQGRELRQTEDTYLVNAAHYFVTEPRFGQGFALKETVHTKGVEDCLSGMDGMGLYKDYRGVPVMGAYRWLENHQMGIISEIDQAAASESIYQLASFIVWTTLAVIAVILGVGVYFARSISNPVRRLVAGTQEVGLGNLEYRVDIKTHDEFTELSRSFNQMTEQLQETTVSREELRKLNQGLEQRVAERTAELEDMNAFRDSIMQHSPTGIVVYNEDGQCVLVNQSAARLVGASMEDLFSQNFRTINSWQKTDLLSSAEESLRTGETQRNTVTMTTTFGKWVHLDCRFSTFRMKSDTHLLLLLNDITGLKEKETTLKRKTGQLQAANKELEAFAYSVSHDLRAPLRAIDGYTRILEEDYTPVLDDEGRRLLGVVCSEAFRMGQLIDALLSYSRLGRAELQYSEIDVGVLAHSIFYELTTSKDRERIVFQAKNIPRAQGDPSLMRQVWTNLIANAVKYTSKRDQAVITVSGEGIGDEIVYSIRDNGAGYDMQFADKLFGVFQRLHSQKEFEGTGVGLAIVQRAVMRHGGRVWAEGKIENGAAFFFSLPL
ncbi:MAG: HAMP domain-containing protein [Desulfohalobiaceae bacterium]|nr:HAMP domain-containing protein [Desulfohalobiaceae bacterium]